VYRQCGGQEQVQNAAGTVPGEPRYFMVCLAGAIAAGRSQWRGRHLPPALPPPTWARC
jgi:hypothetical protein